MKVLARSWSSPAGRFVAALTAVLAVAALSVVVAPSAQATHMESQSLTPSSSGPGATASYAFEWVHGTGNAPAPVGSSYRFTFPAGFDVSGVSLGSGSISGVPFTATVDVAGQVVTLTSISQGAAVGNAIRVVLDGVVNRTAAGTAFVAVQMLTPESSLSSGGSFSTTIANGPIDRLELTDSSGNPLGPQTAGQAVDLRIRALDEFGNLVNGTGGGPDFTGTVDLTSNARAAAGLGTTAAFSGGQVVHSVTLTEATDTATMTATVSGGALAATTAAFEIAPGPAHHLQVVQSPTGARSGEVLSPALVVEVRDEFDNLVTAATGPIRVELVGSGAELSGTVEAAAVLGVATFSDLRITGAGDALALRVSYVPGGLAAADTADTAVFAVEAAAAPPASPPAAPPAAPLEPPTPPRGTASAATGPSELALTGPGQAGPMVLLGLALLVAGACALRASRRPSVPAGEPQG